MIQTEFPLPSAAIGMAIGELPLHRFICPIRLKFVVLQLVQLDFLVTGSGMGLIDVSKLKW